MATNPAYGAVKQDGKSEPDAMGLDQRVADTTDDATIVNHDEAATAAARVAQDPNTASNAQSFAVGARTGANSSATSARSGSTAAAGTLNAAATAGAASAATAAAVAPGAANAAMQTSAQAGSHVMGAAGTAASHAPGAAGAAIQVGTSAAGTAASHAPGTANAARSAGEAVATAGSTAGAEAYGAGAAAAGAAGAAAGMMAPSIFRRGGQVAQAASQGLDATAGMAVRATAESRRLAGLAIQMGVGPGLAVFRTAARQGRAALEWTLNGASSAGDAAQRAITQAASNVQRGGTAGMAAMSQNAGVIAQAVSSGAAAAQEAGTSAGEAIGDAAGTVGDAAGDAGYAIGNAAGSAAGAAGRVAGQAANAGGQAINAAGQTMAPAARVVASGAGQAAGAMAAGAGQAAGAVSNMSSLARQQALQMGTALAQSSMGRRVAMGATEFAATSGNMLSTLPPLQIPWDSVGKLYDQSKASIAVAAAAALGVASSCTGLLEAEVIRDVFQPISLVFASIRSQALENAKIFYGNVASLFSLDLSYITDGLVSPVTMYIIIGILALIVIIAFIWMVYTSFANNPDPFIDGHESKDWAQQSEENSYTVLAIQYILTAALSLYLPVGRSVLQIFVCEGSLAKFLEDTIGDAELNCVIIIEDPETYKCDCGAWDGYAGIQTLAVFLLIFLIFLPLFCWYMVTQNAPVGSDEDPEKRFDPDSEGTEKSAMVQYSDAMYNNDLQNDPKQRKSPFLFLYDGYERKWRYYKMAFKFALIVPVVALVENPVGQSIATLVVLLMFSALSAYSAPFISPQSDMMDTSGRVTTFFTVMFGFIAIEQMRPSSAAPMGVLINVVNTINFLAIIGLLLATLPSVRSFFKNQMGRFTFSDTTYDTRGPSTSIIPGWDVFRELKHRVWQTYWDSLLANKEEFPEESGVYKRHIQLKNRTNLVGVEHIVGHWDSLTDPRMMGDLNWCMQHLEGVDVYFQGETDYTTAPRVCYGLCRGDAAKVVTKSKSHFGKMWIREYPFQAIVVFDDCSGESFPYTVIQGHQREIFWRLVYQNRFDTNIQRKKQFRLSIRALHGQRVKLVYQKVKKRTYPDGTTTDSKGKTKTHYSTISIVFYYEWGRFTVGNNRDPTNWPWAAGFAPAGTWHGEGDGVLPRTGRHVHATDEDSMSASELGIQPAMERVRGSHMDKIFYFPENQSTIATNIPLVRQRAAQYRQNLMKERFDNAKRLNDAFWMHVYNAFGAPRAGIEAYLSAFEMDENVQSIPTKHVGGLDYLYARVNAVSRHPAAGFWFLFWQDLWVENQDMSHIVPSDEDRKLLIAKALDPRYPSAIAYTPQPREDLEKQLVELKLMPEPSAISGLCSLCCDPTASHFRPQLLDLLYEGMVARSKHVEVSLPGFASGAGDGVDPAVYQRASSTIEFDEGDTGGAEKGGMSGAPQLHGPAAVPGMEHPTEDNEGVDIVAASPVGDGDRTGAGPQGDASRRPPPASAWPSGDDDIMGGAGGKDSKLEAKAGEGASRDPDEGFAI